MPHQVFFRIPTDKPITLGLELDLFGVSAVQRLVNCLTFISKSRSRSYSIDGILRTKTDWENCLKSIYSFDINRGLYQPANVLEVHCVADPCLCHSNGGIALISLMPNPPYNLPKYCFLNLGQMNCAVSVPEYVPLSANAYLQAFHHDFIAGNLPVEFKVKLHALASEADLFPVLEAKEIAAFFPRHFSLNVRSNPRIPLLPSL